MAVQRSRRTSAAAHTAWRRPLTCAVSVAATLCCFFVPGAVSPMPPYFPAERGRNFIESCKKDTLENQLPTLLDNAPEMEEAFELARESFPWIGEVLKGGFLDSDPASKEPFKLELGSADVERYIDRARPKFPAVAKSLLDIKLEDFDEMAKAVLRHTDFNRKTPRSKRGMNVSELIREDDLKKEMKTVFKRGFVTASFSKQDKYAAKPSDVSNDLKTWVQAGIKRRKEDANYYVKLTLHPNVKSDEPEGSVFSFCGTYEIDGNGEPKSTKRDYKLVDLNHANSTGKLGEGGTAWKNLKKGLLDQKILDCEFEDDVYLSSNISPISSSWTKSPNYFNRIGAYVPKRTPPNEDDMRNYFKSKVKIPATADEYQRDFSIKIWQDSGYGKKRLRSFGIERTFTLINSDSSEKPFYKEPGDHSRSSLGLFDGKYKARLNISQQYTHYRQEKTEFEDALDEIQISIGFFVDEKGICGSVCSPLSYNLLRVVTPASPGGQDKTKKVSRHLSYKSARDTSIMHTSQLTPKAFFSGSYEYDTKGRFPLGVTDVKFFENKKDFGKLTQNMKPVRFRDSNEKDTLESDEKQIEGASALSLSSDVGMKSSEEDEQRMDCEDGLLSKNPDSEREKKSLICETLLNGGLLFIGIIAVFIFLTAWLESSEKRKRLKTTQSRFGDLSDDNVFKEYLF